MYIKLIVVSLFLTLSWAQAQTTAFTYQGKLNDGSSAANGNYDLTFALFTVGSGAGQVGITITKTATPVSNGLFTVMLDFGVNFPGANRWLEIAVRTNGGGGFTTLAPRQQITTSPYALTAAAVTGLISAGQLTGTIASDNIGAGTITSTMLAAGSVTSTQLADGSVNNGQLAEGAVSLSKLSAALTVSQSCTFTNPAPALYAYFGNALAAVGTDKLLVGTFWDDTGAGNSGAAYLFSTGGNLLVTFTNPTPTFNDYFGSAVAAVGTDKVLIGANEDDTGATNSGAAYLFNINGTLLATFTNPTPTLNDRFGSSLTALGTDRVLIGAPYDDTGATDAGAAYLFDLNGTLLTTFTKPVQTAFANLGSAVTAVGGDKLLIAADGDSTAGSVAGAAYLFNTNGTLLRTFTKPTAPVFIESFGTAVAEVGSDKLLIGVRGLNNAGAAYLFNIDGTLLTTFNNPTQMVGDSFGSSVSAVGTDRVLIGARSSDTGATNAGAAYLFSTSGRLLATLINPTADLDDNFGEALVAVGGDKLVIGSRSDDVGGTDSGVAHSFNLNSYMPGLIISGNGSGLTNLAAATFTNSGVPITNDYAKVVTRRPRLLKTPPLGIDLWYLAGIAHDESTIRTYVDILYTNGLVDLGWKYVTITEGWQGGRTNGVLMPDGTKYPNITNTITYAHDRGVKIRLYTEPSATTSAGLTGSPQPYFENDIRAFDSWGVDDIQLDLVLSTLNMENRLMAAREFAHILRTVTTRPITLYSGGFRTPQFESSISNANWYDVISTMDSYRSVGDLGAEVPGYNNLWTNYVGEFMGAALASAEWAGTPTWHQMDHAICIGGGATETNVTYGTFSGHSIMASPIFVGVMLAPGADGFRYSVATNRTFLRIHQDLLGRPGRLVDSNINYLTLVRDLTDGDKAVCFLNQQTNSATTATFTAAQLGWPRNTAFTYVNTWRNDSGYWTNALTYSIPAMGGDLFLVRRADSNPITGTDWLSLRNVPAGLAGGGVASFSNSLNIATLNSSNVFQVQTTNATLALQVGTNADVFLSNAKFKGSGRQIGIITNGGNGIVRLGGTNEFISAGYYGVVGLAGIWANKTAPTTSDFILAAGVADTYLNAPAFVYTRIANNNVARISSTNLSLYSPLIFVGDGLGITNLNGTQIFIRTNTLGNAVVDFAKVAATTNMAGSLTFTGISNFNPTNENVFVLHCMANGADRTITPAAGWLKTRSAFVVTNGTMADIVVKCQVGLYTNITQTDYVP